MCRSNIFFSTLAIYPSCNGGEHRTPRIFTPQGQKS